MGRLAKVVQGQSQSGLKAYKKGGAVKSDAKEDMAMLHKAGCKCMKCGGKVGKKK